LRVEEELEKGGRVFVYRENRNGSSAAICFALVMDTILYYSFCGWKLTVDGTITAREFVQRKWYSVDIPNLA
jgi:hypothetical protein